MTRYKPLARFTYASAFFVPFFWAAFGNTVPLIDGETGDPFVIADTVPTANRAALNIQISTDPGPAPFLTMAQHPERMDLLHKAITVPPSGS